MQQGYLNSCQTDEVTNTQLHHRFRAAISPPTVILEIIFSPLNEDETLTSEKVFFK